MRDKSPELNTNQLIPFFVLSAVVANLIMAPLLFLEFTCMALFQHDPKAFQTGLWLVPYVTVVIWGSATVIFFLTLAARGLMTIRRLVGKPQRTARAKSEVWDDWLDGPEPHVR